MMASGNQYMCFVYPLHSLYWRSHLVVYAVRSPCWRSHLIIYPLHSRHLCCALTLLKESSTLCTHFVEGVFYPVYSLCWRSHLIIYSLHSSQLCSALTLLKESSTLCTHFVQTVIYPLHSLPYILCEIKSQFFGVWVEVIAVIKKIIPIIGNPEFNINYTTLCTHFPTSSWLLL